MAKKKKADNTPIMMLSMLTLFVMMVPLYFIVNSENKLSSSQASEVKDQQNELMVSPSPSPNSDQMDSTLKVTM